MRKVYVAAKIPVELQDEIHAIGKQILAETGFEPSQSAVIGKLLHEAVAQRRHRGRGKPTSKTSRSRRGSPSSPEGKGNSPQ